VRRRWAAGERWRLGFRTALDRHRSFCGVVGLKPPTAGWPLGLDGLRQFARISVGPQHSVAMRQPCCQSDPRRPIPACGTCLDVPVPITQPPCEPVAGLAVGLNQECFEAGRPGSRGCHAAVDGAADQVCKALASSWWMCCPRFNRRIATYYGNRPVEVVRHSWPATTRQIRLARAGPAA